jgi:hypothetical protein
MDKNRILEFISIRRIITSLVVFIILEKMRLLDKALKAALQLYDD